MTVCVNVVGSYILCHVLSELSIRENPDVADYVTFMEVLVRLKSLFDGFLLEFSSVDFLNYWKIEELGIFDDFVPRQAFVSVVPNAEQVEVPFKTAVMNAVLCKQVLSTQSPAVRDFMRQRSVQGL